jgi:hypothetical protein
LELLGARPALTRSEALAFAAVLALFTAGIFCVFLTAGELRHALLLLLAGDGKRKKNIWGGKLKKQLVCVPHVRDCCGKKWQGTKVILLCR